MLTPRRTATLALLLLFPAALAAPPEAETLVREARLAVESFQKELQGELMAGLKAGGPAKAIEVCRTRAPEIAAERSKETGFRVARTALRVRNAANAPDDWERAALAEFEARLAKGEDPSSVEKVEVVEQAGRRFFRYARAIRTGEGCLACHGAAPKPEVSEKVKALYPSDRATGFAAGSLRGAFTLTKPLS